MRKAVLFSGILSLFILCRLLAPSQYLFKDMAELPVNHPDHNWDHGAIVHILPTVSHDRILLKASFAEAMDAEPSMVIGNRSFPGHMTDTKGLFWSFGATGLTPGHTYQLELENAAGRKLCDPWPF